MIHEKIVRDDLLYHSAHGLCRVNELIKENRAGKEVICYALVPKSTARRNVRFVIADSDMNVSGFHPLVSIKEANEILSYLKTRNAVKAIPVEERDHGASRFNQENHPWKLAQGLMTFADPAFETKDQRKRQFLERSAKGLVEELAIVFKITSKETASKIRKCLGNASTINPLVLDALQLAVAN